MAYAQRTTTRSLQGAALIVAGLLQAALAITLVEGLTMAGPPNLPRSQQWPLFYLHPLPRPQPPPPPCNCPPPCFGCGDPRPEASAEPPLRQPVKPSNSPSEWLTLADYPHYDLRQGHQGKAGFRLDIDRRGKVTACTILQSSGFAGLDEAVCRHIPRRARFTPPTDHKGRPALGTYTSQVRWLIPD